VPIDTPKLRQVDKGSDRRFQWQFADGEWRDMVPREGISFKDVNPYSWVTDKKPYPHVDFDTFLQVHGDNMLPEHLRNNSTAAYMEVLKLLWADVTGLDPQPYQSGVVAGGNKGFLWDEKKKTWSNQTYTGDSFNFDTQAAVTWNWDGREATWQKDKELLEEEGGDPRLLGANWNEAAQTEMARYMSEFAEDAAEEFNWAAVAQGRGYTDIDFSANPFAGYQFISRAQDDLERGRIYTDHDKYKGLDMADAPLGPRMPTDAETRAAMPTSPTDRKVVGEYESQTMAHNTAQSIENATVEPSNGKWLVTIPSGQGGWENADDAQEWLDQTSPEDSDRFEVVPGTMGQWYVREKAEEQRDLQYSTPTTYERDDAGNLVLNASGNPIVTPGTPGDMFEPTITEDPTGRRFGLDSQGRLQDFGYGMAGDITQESLAGYQVPHRSLDMIVAKAIERANWPLARAVQAFKDRPTERELLDYAAQYAESPADLAVLSAIARGEHMVQPAVPLPEGMGTGMGQATRIGPPGEVYTSAYKSFIDSMNQGYVPNEDELRDLFDPKNDPAYIATKELADKYETEIGILRDTISEANKSASERIEKTQTNTLNMMSGMFDKTISSFQDIMKTTTNMQEKEIAALFQRQEDERTAKADAKAAMEREEERKRREEEQGKQNNQPKIDPPSGSEATNVILDSGSEAAMAPATPPAISEASEPYDPGSEFTGRGSGPIRPAVPEITSQRTPASTPSFQQVIKDTGAGVGWMGMSAPTPPPPPTPAPASDVSSMAAWGFAEGGVVQGPTMALLGEKEPEFIVPFSKVDEFKRGLLPMGKPRPTHQGSTVAKFEDSIPRFANGGMVTGPRFGGVTGGELQPYGESGAYVRPETRKELELGAEGIYGADGISRAPRIAPTDFQSLVQQYATPNVFLNEEQQRRRNVGNIPEYELRQRLGASEFAGTNPAQHPIGIQQLMAGRPISRPRSLMTAANMPTPSGQALKNMLPSELAYYQKMGRQAGIPQEQLEREMRAAIPGGTRRTPLRMGARRVRQA